MQESIQTKDQVAAEFKKDLAALLKKYSGDNWKAVISITEKCTPWTSSYWMEVCIPPLYNKKGDIISEGTAVNLGQNFTV